MEQFFGMVYFEQEGTFIIDDFGDIVAITFDMADRTLVSLGD